MLMEFNEEGKKRLRYVCFTLDPVYIGGWLWRLKQDHLTCEINPLIVMKSLMKVIKPSLAQLCASSTVAS